MDRSELQRLERFRAASRRSVASRPVLSAQEAAGRAKARFALHLSGAVDSAWLSTREKLIKDHDRSAIKVPKGLLKKD